METLQIYAAKLATSPRGEGAAPVDDFQILKCSLKDIKEESCRERKVYDNFMIYRTNNILDVDL